MESRYIKLPRIQSSVLAHTFETIYENIEDDYMKYVEVDEIFYVLIGGDLDPNMFELIERSCIEDPVSYLTAINLNDWLRIIEQEASKLEYYEICNNCVKFNKKLDEVLQASDSYYLSECND